MPKENVELAPYTTFRIGGPANYFFECKSIEDLKEAAEFAQNKNLPIFILGGGSNILINDKGFPGVVIKVSILGIETKDLPDTYEVTASAGESWDGLVEFLVSKKIGGLENLSLIPGSVGAAPVQNIGAYGSELSSFIYDVYCFDTKTLSEKKLSNKECLFGYRDSIFKKKEGASLIVTKVVFHLSKNLKPNLMYRDLADYFSALSDEPTPEGVRRAVINIRNAKLPNVKNVGTAGSFFKNPILSKEETEKLLKKYPEIPFWDSKTQGQKISAAYLIDKICDMKGESVGEASVWPKQALVLVNNGNAKASEVISLAKKIEDCVKEKTGVVLEKEVQII